MKYTPVTVLVLCAIVAQASVVPADLTKIKDELSKEMEVPIANARQQIKVVTQNIEKLSDPVLRKFLETDAQSKSMLTELTAMIAEKIENLKVKGEAFQKCIDQQQEEIDALKEEAANEIGFCTEGADQSAVSYNRAIRDDFDELTNRDQELYEIVEQCVEYMVNMADKCVYRRLEEIQNVVNGIMFATKSVTRIAAQDVKNAEQCNQAAYDKTVQGLEDIVQKFEKCSEN